MSEVLMNFTEPPIRKIPKKAYRDGWVNRKYPKGPHQGKKEKARRAKRLAKLQEGPPR